MRPVEPRPPIDGWVRVEFAKDQRQYEPLLANISSTVVAAVETEWQPSPEELAQLAAGCRVRLTVLTFRHPLQPVILQVVAG